MIGRVYRAGAHLKRIRDNAERRSIGLQLVEQLQLYCRQLGRQVGDAGDVRAGPVGIGGKTRCDRGHRRRYRGSTPALTPTDIVRKNSMQPSPQAEGATCRLRRSGDVDETCRIREIRRRRNREVGQR